MRPASGCKLFGAYQALGGIQDGVVLLHSVVGCNFGSMSLHVAQDMRDIRQTCTVISDSDVVFSGEASLERAVRSAPELPWGCGSRAGGWMAGTAPADEAPGPPALSPALSPF